MQVGDVMSLDKLYLDILDAQYWDRLLFVLWGWVVTMGSIMQNGWNKNLTFKYRE